MTTELNIRVSWDPTPAEYDAVLDEYDGAPDAGPQPRGSGRTEREAIEALLDAMDIV